MKKLNKFLKITSIFILLLLSNQLIAQTNTSATQTVCVGSTGEPYLIPTPTTGSIFNWTISSGGTIASGNGTNQIAVDWGNTPGGPHTITVTETDAFGCIGADVTVVVTLTDAATANAGSPDNVCAGNAYSVISATATNYSVISWSTTGTGTFSGGTTLTPTYTPSAADIAAGNVTLTLTALGNSPCSDATSAMVLTIIPAPTAYAGPDDAICEGIPYVFVSGPTTTNSTVVLWSTSGDGTFTGGTTLTPTYTPGTVDIANGTVNLTITATGTAPCTTIANTMTLTINPTPLTGPINHW